MLAERVRLPVPPLCFVSVRAHTTLHSSSALFTNNKHTTPHVATFKLFCNIIKIGLPGPGDMLPGDSSTLYGWDKPCPTDMAQLQLGASLWPLNLNSSSSSTNSSGMLSAASQPQQQLQCTLNVRKIGERAVLQVPEVNSSSSSSAGDTVKKRVEVVVEVSAVNSSALCFTCSTYMKVIMLLYWTAECSVIAHHVHWLSHCCSIVQTMHL
jgi:hypothetical protein